MKEKLYKLMNWPEIEAVIYSEEDNPHKLLGRTPWEAPRCLRPFSREHPRLRR